MTAARRNWTREETLAAFALYCRTPFGRLHSRNPDIVLLAKRLKRTAGAVALRCVNLASLDDTIPQKGMSNVSQMDRDVWADFRRDPDAISFEAVSATAKLNGESVLAPEIEAQIDQLRGEERERLVRVRVNQGFFRQLVLSSFESRCAVCELPLPELLVAAHIVPWASDPSLRMNPRNGLCLCGTHDKAYETGVLRIEADYSIRAMLPEGYAPSEPVERWLTDYSGRKIALPKRWLPDPVLLRKKLGLLGG